jgi:hypothetical protein
VTLASATVARSENLAIAIERAGGGFVDRVEARALAGAIARELHGKPQRAQKN